MQELGAGSRDPFKPALVSGFQHLQIENCPCDNSFSFSFEPQISIANLLCSEAVLSLTGLPGSRKIRCELSAS